MKEQWKPIAGYEGIYEISDQGRVKRVAPGPGSSTSTYVGRILNGSLVKGYHQVSLSDCGHRTKSLVHRLVANAFIGPCPSGKEVNHKNGNRTDNRVQNLEYLTRSENQLHAYHVLNRKRPNKLTTEQVKEIRRLHATGHYTQRALAKRFKVYFTTVWHIVHYKTWKHI